MPFSHFVGNATIRMRVLQRADHENEANLGVVKYYVATLAM